MKKILLALSALLLMLGSTSCGKSDSSEGTSQEEAQTVAQEPQDPTEIFRTRRSIRKYKPEMPSMEQIEKVVTAGTYAASGHNAQSATIVAVTSREVRDRLSDIARKVRGNESDSFYGAPAVLVVLGDKKASGSYMQDASLVVGNMMNAAHALGLGTCWVSAAKGIFESEEGKALLREWGLSDELEGISCCIIGIPDESPEPKPRKDNYVIWVK